ncbi:MAG: hypothetical protein K5894_03875 [Lachnospiraceae bacterium]|nr:hypothetical protein [Lachnospiraceae bacterium]
MKGIDVYFDFTTDSPGYWDGFWDRKDGLGYGGCDPDCASLTLQKYHQILWSRELPNGEPMELKISKLHSNYYYLNWNGTDFGSDSIIVSFRYKKYKHMINQVVERVLDYQNYYENLIRRAYTIGGSIIFPVHRSSMNQMKGMNARISDRWDLTLECIRRYYAGEESPLYKTIEADKAFYDLFVDFKRYVDFFYLQDAVSDDYSNVKIWIGNADFNEPGLPKSVDEYFDFIDKEYDFLEKRNRRIEKALIDKI